jgi:hypothetical protein
LERPRTKKIKNVNNLLDKIKKDKKQNS